MEPREAFPGLPHTGDALPMIWGVFPVILGQFTWMYTVVRILGGGWPRGGGVDTHPRIKSSPERYLTGGIGPFTGAREEQIGGKTIYFQNGDPYTIPSRIFPLTPHISTGIMLMTW